MEKNDITFFGLTSFRNARKKFGIKTRNLSQSNTLYQKREFNGNNKLKAYMIGFRLGDLNVKNINKGTIFIKSSTTKKEQEDLIKEEEVIITITRGNYIKRMLPDSFKAQKRGDITPKNDNQKKYGQAKPKGMPG